MAAPVGWPREVPPPDTPGWQRRAVGWLLDQAPGEWRGLPALTRHPLALAYAVGDHVQAARTGLRGSVSGMRARLAGGVAPQAAEDIVSALLGEEARLERLAREVALVTDAFRSQRAGGGAATDI